MADDDQRDNRAAQLNHISPMGARVPAWTAGLFWHGGAGANTFSVDRSARTHARTHTS